MNEKNYIAALEEVAKITRTSIAIFGAPLAILIAQARFLGSVDSYFIAALASGAAFLFAIGTVLAFLSSSWVSFLLAKEKLIQSGNSSGKGFAYLRFHEGLLAKSGVELTEEGLLEHDRKMIRPFQVLLIGGYSLLALLFVAVLWV